MRNLNKDICTIICPMYTSTLDEQYIQAINHNIQVLNKFEFVFIVGKDFNTIFFSQNIVGKYKVLTIDSHHFESIDSYNHLLTSTFFWNLFDSSYVLICQHDAYVFRDELQYWCEQEYAYIGAPVFKGFTKAKPDAKVTNLQNGGFSLRSVEKAVNTLNTFSWSKALTKSLWRLKFDMLFYILKHGFLKRKINEDQFWCIVAPFWNNEFNISSYEQSRQFSFEVNPERLYVENHNNLPFGCHAWNRYSKDFWKKHVININL